MATLAADVAVQFDPRWDIGAIERPATAADTYYRGGLAHSITATGLLTLTPADADYYAGVILEHQVVAAAQELVWVGSAGRWYFACANFTLANVNETFAIQAADLTDNPATLDVTGAGDAGAAGTLWFCTSDGVAGWLDTDNRSLIVNT
jgi:hypothetical protein